MLDVTFQFKVDYLYFGCFCWLSSFVLFLFLDDSELKIEMIIICIRGGDKNKLVDAIAISKSETNNQSLTHSPTDWQGYVLGDAIASHCTLERVVVRLIFQKA